jgi:glycosyltransferase involved in cell wall biosynthesis
MSHPPLEHTITIAIPTYLEGEYIVKSLLRLAKQTLFRMCEVIVADYDPDRSGIVENQIKMANIPNVKYISVPRKGIAFARHLAILSSTCPYVVNFDADVYFEHEGAIERLVSPLYHKEAAVTCPDYVMENSKVKISPIADGVYQAALLIQRHSPLVALEPGMAFTRYVYDEVGGFSDLKQYEGMELSARIVAKYMGMKRYIPEVKVLASPRRLEGFTKYGLIAADYDIPVR